MKHFSCLVLYVLMLGCVIGYYDYQIGVADTKRRMAEKLLADELMRSTAPRKQQCHEDFRWISTIN